MIDVPLLWILWNFKSCSINSYLSSPLWIMEHLTLRKCICLDVLLFIPCVVCTIHSMIPLYWFLCWSFEQGYDISFLITNYHCEEMQKKKLIDFIVQFMEASLSPNLKFLSSMTLFACNRYILNNESMYWVDLHRYV